MRFDQINWRELEKALDEARDYDDVSVAKAVTMLNQAAKELADRLYCRLQQKKDEKNG